GRTPTGHRVPGPASDLVELDEGEALGIRFHAPYRGHATLTESIDPILDFLRAPMLIGLIDLVDFDPAAGEIVYRTPEDLWSVSELLGTLDRLGRKAGPRAALELMRGAARILHEAAVAGERQGILCHG